MKNLINIWNYTTLTFFIIIITHYGLAKIGVEIFEKVVYNEAYQYFYLDHPEPYIILSITLGVTINWINNRNHT